MSKPGDASKVKVWTQTVEGRPYPSLRWHCPQTGRCKSMSARTDDEEKVEELRVTLQRLLRRGQSPDELWEGEETGPGAKRALAGSWQAFRARFEKEYLPGRRPATRDNYRVTLDQFEDIAEPGRMSSITAATLSSFVAGLRAGEEGQRKPMAESTMQVRLQFLRTALQWASDVGLLQALPKFPRVKPPERQPQPVPAEMFERLVAAAEGDEQTQAFLTLAWAAGLRLMEAYNLRWGPEGENPRVDLQANRIILPAGGVKGRADSWLPLAPELAALLACLPRREGAHANRVFLFLGRRTNKPVSRGAMGQRIATLARKAGLRMSYRTLRRGFGCRYAGKVPAQVLQRLMRHRDIKTTLTYYVSCEEAMVDAVMGASRDPGRDTGAGRQGACAPRPDAARGPG